jgi:hypothetical protein
MTVRALCALIVSALVIAGTAGAADASMRSFDLRAGTKKTKGDAHGYGTAWFTQHRRQVSFQGTINDVCDADGKGDGYGAYLNILVKVSGVKGWQGVDAEWDTDGCEEPGNTFGFNTKVLPRGKRYTKVEIQVFEQDQTPHRIFNGDFAKVVIEP